MARSFSCNQAIEVCEASIDYPPDYIPFGDTLNFGTLDWQECMESCTGSPVGWGGLGYSFDWSSEDSSIANISGPNYNQYANVYGTSVGSTFIDAEVWDAYCYVNAAPSPPATVTPDIYFNGNDITGTTQPVVVGQQIPLQASFSLPAGVSISSQSWSVSGTTVGGYNASTNSGQTVSTNFTQQSTTFYWVTAQTGATVTYTVNLSDGAQASATATFNVSGPTNVTVTATAGTVVIQYNDEMSFGDSSGTPGMSFQASATMPTGTPGTFSWVQVVVSSCYTDTPPGSPYCLTPNALDSTYPYDSGASAADSPNVGLTSDLSQVSDTDSFDMYLMWNPGTANSIPVPLGFVAWGWSGDATQNQSTGVWSLNSSSIPSHTFTPSQSFPQWTQVDTNSN